MATLNQIADQVSDALNRPFDDMFKERIKAVFRQESANYIRQQITKHGIDSHFKTRYSTVCKPVNNSDSSLDLNATFNNSCYRSINKVAVPVRYQTDEPFTYVGDISGMIPYIYINLVLYDYDDYLPMVQNANDLEEGQPPAGSPIKYDYRNGYIYVYFKPALESATANIMIEGVHNTYSFIKDESKDSKDADLVYNDDVEFPIPDDIIQMVKDKLISGEFSVIDDKDKIKSPHLDNN
jgi:hypothetical protein